MNWREAQSVYDFEAIDINNNKISLAKYSDRVLLIVNVACNCGLTELNYKQLQELHDKYNENGLSILAFPSNFVNQEPGTEVEIREFVKKEFNVNFDMFSKIEVNGEKAHPLYKFLKYKISGKENSNIKWNFSKYLCNRSGNPVRHYGTNVEPVSMENDIVNLLKNIKSKI